MSREQKQTQIHVNRKMQYLQYLPTASAMKEMHRKKEIIIFIFTWFLELVKNIGI